MSCDLDMKQFYNHTIFKVNKFIKLIWQKTNLITASQTYEFAVFPYCISL